MTESKVKRSLSPRRILLIDDDALLRNTLADSFIDAGFEIETAVDGESGLTKLFAKTEYKIDLVILDWRMSGLTGIGQCPNLTVYLFL
jgi:DNA-binding response OmpR family regulator